ncbi:MAG: acetyltransferase [Balneolaceae bacterium]|nr:acetyltransferase [Balneolaceae bacterium]
MNVDINHSIKMTLFGYCAGNTPIVVETACESLQISGFDIVKNVNIDIPKNLAERFGTELNVSHADRYSYERISNIHFGVLDAHLKNAVFHYFRQNFGIHKEMYTSIIHPKSHLTRSVNYETGLLIEPMAVVSSESKIGFGVTIKRSSSVGHHVTLGDFVTINPGAILSGNVTLGEGTTIGSGTTIIHNITIGKHSLIGAGSVVTRDIPDGVVAYGNPCKVVRNYDRWEKVRIADEAGK